MNVGTGLLVLALATVLVVVVPREPPPQASPKLPVQELRTDTSVVVTRWYDAQKRCEYLVFRGPPHTSFFAVVPRQDGRNSNGHSCGDYAGTRSEPLNRP